MSGHFSILVGVCLLAGVSALRAAPPAPALEELELRDSISQYGITWTFAEPARVGTFVNGDYYVVGAVTIESVDPAPRGSGESFRNGSMLNPPVDGSSAYDGRFTNITAADLAQAAQFPLRMNPGDSLVSSISLDERQLNQVLHGPHPDRPEQSPLRTMAVLTCLADPVPPDTFRPGYADLEKDRLRRAADIRWDLVPRVELTQSAPAMADVERMFERPWIDHVRGWASRDVHASENMPGYGREVGRAVSIGALMLMGDMEPQEKATLMHRFIQVGIDNWSVAKRGGGWPAQGGFGNGRKLPIVFAAVMLQDEEMLDIAGNAPRAVFGEDQHTEFGPSWTGAEVRFTGQFPEVYAQDPQRYASRGPYEHLPPEQWPGEQPTLSEGYRRCCTAISWVGQALVVRMLGAEHVWNHDAFFAYVDRWMTEDDSEHIERIRAAHGSAPGIRQGSTEFDPFVDEMWARYRDGLAGPN
jgi:hypothetical protein